VVLALSITAYAAADFSGPVVSVLDGDTIEVLHNHHPNVSARISGILAAESGQAVVFRSLTQEVV
jgi:endonuclease YncB( thermonuclease family)